MSEESNILETITSLLASSESPEEEIIPEKQEEENTDSQIDIGMVLKLGSMFSELNSDDERARLLRDLKPFLSSDKKEKVDSAIKILKLLKIAEKAKNEQLF